MSPLSPQLGRYLFALAVVVLFVYAACTQGKSAFDPQVGDCIVPPETTGDGVIEAERTIDCSEPNGGEVVAVFDVAGDDYPGEDALLEQAVAQCPSKASLYNYPTEESWNESGRRKVACIAVSLFDLEVGDCLDYPAEAATVGQVERVDCSEPHDAKVTGAVELPEGDFPGENAISDQASLYCPEGANNYLGPTRESWERLDDREILCLEE